MSVATIDGAAVFGIAPTYRPPAGPRAHADWTTFGEPGVASLDGGFRGWRSGLAGVLVGAIPFDYGASLAAAFAALRAFDDGQAHDLADPSGWHWPGVMLESFAPRGRIRQTADGFFYQEFTVEFLHLSDGRPPSPPTDGFDPDLGPAGPTPRPAPIVGTGGGGAGVGELVGVGSGGAGPDLIGTGSGGMAPGSGGE